MKFNWKSIFINEEGGESSPSEKTESTSSVTSFPVSAASGSKFPNERQKGDLVNNTTLNAIIEMYESGFESLNQPGYDFYEFFKAIKAVGSNDPQVYKMALTIAQSSDPKVTKSALLSQAEFYIEEINKVHAQYEREGSTKKTQLQEAQRNKKAYLTSEVAALEKKLMEIQSQINSKKNELQTIDSNLIADVAEIDQKIIANNLAKEKILESIVTVVNGIKGNI